MRRVQAAAELGHVAAAQHPRDPAADEHIMVADLVRGTTRAGKLVPRFLPRKRRGDLETLAGAVIEAFRSAVGRSRQELAQVERLGDIVVRTELEPDHLVGLELHTHFHQCVHLAVDDLARQLERDRKSVV